MILLLLRANVTEQQVDHVIERIEKLSFRAHLGRRTHRSTVGVIGDEERLRVEPLKAIPGVAEVVPVMPAYKSSSDPIGVAS